LEGEVGAFLRQYERKAAPNIDPNDRQYDREIEQLVKRMDPNELDELMHGSEEEGLEKDTAIFELVDRLRASLGRSSFQVVDHWDADREAIGVAHPRDVRVLAYLALTADPLRYTVYLELPSKDDDEFPYSAAGEHHDVTFEELVGVVRQHLDVVE
jgi:hypothetical protein